MEPITIYIGSQFTQQLTITNNSTGLPLDITGYTILFTAKPKRSIAVDDALDTNAVIKEEITSHDDPENGITTLTIPAADTEIEPGNYICDLRAYLDVDNDHYSSPFLAEVKYPVTQRSS